MPLFCDLGPPLATRKRDESFLSSLRSVLLVTAYTHVTITHSVPDHPLGD